MGLLNRITGQNQSAKQGGLLERAKSYRKRDQQPADAPRVSSKKKPSSKKPRLAIFSRKSKE